MKIASFIATSLDGFIARPNGNIDWLPQPKTGEDYGYQAFFKNIDTLIMGRNTYEKVCEFDAWPYGETSVIVLSSNNLKIPDTLPNIAQMSGELKTIVHQLEQSGTQSIYVDGGVTVQQFINVGLIDEITISVIPILIGSGLSLFGELTKDHPLRLLHSKSYDSGIIQSTYSFR